MSALAFVSCVMRAVIGIHCQQCDKGTIITWLNNWIVEKSKEIPSIQM